jgi:hypothetical protein
MNLPSHWYIIARSVEVKSKKPWAVMRFGIPLVMWRDSQGELVVMEDRCPHRFAQLSLGELKDGQLECPFHGFQFDAQGNCQWVPELGRAVPKLCVKTFRIIERAGWIWMWWGRAEPTQEAPEFFSQVDDSFCTAYLKERWKTHLTRSIENQLDYAHLPYVHRKTIGRFATSVQTLPEMILDQQQIKWFFSESEGKSATSYIEFRFPNLWINRISETYGITLVFVPVDDQTTDLYLQNHRKFLNIPGLNRLIDFFMVLLNRRILNEDQRVVLSQTPRDVREAQDEVLFPSDRAIQHFRKWVDAGGSI